MLPGVSPALPGALLCNGKHVILRQRVRDSVRAVTAVRNTRVFQTETTVVADVQSVFWKFLCNAVKNTNLVSSKLNKLKHRRYCLMEMLLLVVIFSCIIIFHYISDFRYVDTLAKTKLRSLNLFSLLYPQNQKNEIEVSLQYGIALLCQSAF